MNKLVTLAIHTKEKALILKSALENENIEVFTENVATDNANLSGTRVRINESDLAKALNVVENKDLFNYNEEETYRIDDGRRRILVPIDFSEYSLKSCQMAFNLARVLNAKVKILHVYFNPYYPSALPMAEALSYQPQDETIIQNIIDKVRADIKKLCTAIDDKVAAGEFPPVNYSYVLREGLPEEEIGSYAKEYKPSLIIMGTRGKDQKDADLIGSVTAEVIEMTRVPVLTIPENVHLHFYDTNRVRHISFLTNFSERDLISFAYMISILKNYNVKIHLTHIVSKKTDSWDEIKLEEIKAYFKKNYPEIDTDCTIIDATKDGDLLKSLDLFVKKEKIDIIALTTAKRNLFARLFSPSVSRKILFYSDTPLLVLRG